MPQNAEIIGDVIITDTVQNCMDKAYHMAIEHALGVVKREVIPTTDLTVIMTMQNMKNSIIAKLLSLQS